MEAIWSITAISRERSGRVLATMGEEEDKEEKEKQVEEEVELKA